MTLAEYHSHVTEAQFQQQLVQAAQLLGYRCYHTAFSIGSDRGFPDLVLVRDRIVVLEVKSERGKVRPGQQAWIDAFAAVPGVVARIVRPSDFDEIVAVLRGEEERAA